MRWGVGSIKVAGRPSSIRCLDQCHHTLQYRVLRLIGPPYTVHLIFINAWTNAITLYNTTPFSVPYDSIGVHCPSYIQCLDQCHHTLHCILHITGLTYNIPYKNIDVQYTHCTSYNQCLHQCHHPL